MNRYEMVFNGDTGATAPVPQLGETLEIAGELWDVDSIDEGGAEGGRIHLVHHVDDDVQAHIRFKAAKPAPTPPTSFESELVYTLNDLSTRLSTLASVLTAYWGKGAA